MTVLRLVPLTLGWQELDRCIALDGYPPGEGDRIPIPGWVIERDDDGLVLYDNARHYPDPPSSRITEIRYGTCGDF